MEKSPAHLNPAILVEDAREQESGRQDDVERVLWVDLDGKMLGESLRRQLWKKSQVRLNPANLTGRVSVQEDGRRYDVEKGALVDVDRKLRGPRNEAKQTI